MFGFLIKKAFFDLWDNMLRVLLMNLGFILILAVLLPLAQLFLAVPALFVASMAVGVGLFALYTGVASRVCAEIADYKQPGFADLPRFLKESFGSSLLLALAVGAYLVVVSQAFPFYGALKSFAGPVAVAVLFWVTVGCLWASQYFFPLQSRMDHKFRKIVRKAFLLFFDNPGFTLGLFVSTVVTLALSAVTLLLLPGLSAILLLWNVALKLRLYKYDWLEQNPGTGRRAVPWDALLVEDRERVGKRTLKGMIFPWRE